MHLLKCAIGTCGLVPLQTGQKPCRVMPCAEIIMSLQESSFKSSVLFDDGTASTYFYFHLGSLFHLHAFNMQTDGEFCPVGPEHTRVHRSRTRLAAISR